LRRTCLGFGSRRIVFVLSFVVGFGIFVGFVVLDGIGLAWAADDNDRTIGNRTTRCWCLLAVKAVIVPTVFVDSSVEEMGLFW